MLKAREEAYMAWKAIGTIRGNEAADKVTERDIVVRWVRCRDYARLI